MTSKDCYQSEKMHKLYKGKIEIVPKVPITSLDNFSIWYTPRVTEPCRKISQGGEDLSFEYTWRWNAAAVISDGTRALGLGNIGSAAGFCYGRVKCCCLNTSEV